MSVSLLSRSSALLLFAFAAETMAAGITEIFDVTAGGSVTLYAESASIVVSGENVSTASFNIERGTDDASSIESDYLIEFSIENNQISGEIKRRNRTGNWFNRGLQITIQLPENFDIDLQSSGGGITVENLNGVIKTRTSGGPLHYERVDGPITGRTSGGSIYLEGTSGDAELNTSGGRITVGSVGGYVQARTSGGGISIEQAGGPVTARTSGGRITVNEVRDTLEAHTSGGGIVARFTEQPQADCRLTTSGGSINVGLSPDVAVSLEARTSGSRVHSEIPVTIVGTTSKSRLEGDLNGGGPLLFLRTSGGDIHLKAI